LRRMGRILACATASGGLLLSDSDGQAKHWREGLGLTLCLVRCL